jgi:hypothetical protein
VKLLCADPIANQQVLTNSAAIGSARAKTVQPVACQNGQHATAAGLEVLPFTAGLDGEFAVTNIHPVAPAGPLPSPSTFRVTVYKEDPASSDARIYVHVLCA